jgi:hypothetical protein
MTVKMVMSASVFSIASVVVMGTIGVTMLHPWGPGDLELPPVPEVALASSDESLRALSVFFAPTRYRVVKITHCSSVVVL